MAGALDRRGNWLIKGSRIGNAALRDIIGRNYQPDEDGRWYFQNGPQRVYVGLAYTPLVVHYEGDKLVDQRNRPFRPEAALEDDEGSVLLQGEGTVALLDDRDLVRFADSASTAGRIERAAVASRFRFQPDPKPATSP